MLPPSLDGGLVSSTWLAEHLTDPHLVVIEISRDPAAYGRGHIAGAVDWSGERLLIDPIRGPRRLASAMERLLAASGIDNYSTVVVYSDAINLAAAAIWRLVLCGHTDVRLLDGGRATWLREVRALDTRTPQRVHTTYKAGVPDRKWRAVPRDLTPRPGASAPVVVDGGLGDITRPYGIRVPWNATLGPGGTFKPADTLESLFAAYGITRTHHVVTCSSDSTASAHLWFALSQILGFPHVRNCEGAPDARQRLI